MRYSSRQLIASPDILRFVALGVYAYMAQLLTRSFYSNSLDGQQQSTGFAGSWARILEGFRVFFTIVMIIGGHFALN